MKLIKGRKKILTSFSVCLLLVLSTVIENAGAGDSNRKNKKGKSAVTSKRNGADSVSAIKKKIENGEVFLCPRKWADISHSYTSLSACVQFCQGRGFLHPKDGVICYEKREEGQVIRIEKKELQNGVISVFCTCGMVHNGRVYDCKSKPGNVIAKYDEFKEEASSSIRKDYFQQCSPHCKRMTIFATRFKNLEMPLAWCHPTVIHSAIVAGYTEYKLTGVILPDKSCACKLDYDPELVTTSIPHDRSRGHHIFVREPRPWSPVAINSSSIDLKNHSP